MGRTSASSRSGAPWTRSRSCQSGSAYLMKNHRSAAPAASDASTARAASRSTWSAVAVPVNSLRYSHSEPGGKRRGHGGAAGGPAGAAVGFGAGFDRGFDAGFGAPFGAERANGTMT